LREGAFASTIAHDAHNLVVCGVDDRSMARCVDRLREIGGGLAVAPLWGEVQDLPLEIAGLMSRRSASAVVQALCALEETLRGMGVRVATPFMYLGFLALSVIPELRLTDRGLVDVQRFELVPLGVA
jgi:adenine deaminase